MLNLENDSIKDNEKHSEYLTIHNGMKTMRTDRFRSLTF